MQANMDKLVHVKLEGKMAKLLVMIDPKLYRKHVGIERGKHIPICRVAQGTVQHTQGITAILEATHETSKELGI
jgi:hypothetical protein